MQCPSCGHEQSGPVECEKCGIIFARYLKRQEELARGKTSASRPQGTGIKAAALICLVGLSGAGYYFLSRPSPLATLPLPAETTTTAEGQSSGRNGYPPPRLTPQPAATANLPTAQGGLIGQFADGYAPGNAIEWARNATVYIKTPWGSGSGFFVSTAGHIITNRHVVEFDPATMKRLKEQAAQLEEQLNQERKTIQLFRQQLAQLAEGELRRQAGREMEKRQANYEKYRQLQEKIQVKLREIEQASWVADIKVVLIDGSEFAVQSLNLSGKTDLALLTIDCINAPAIKPVADSLHIPQGQKVYTIGNPAGLRHTVTSGIISGYRQFKGKTLVQTDAAINPGNSGGPLIDEAGNLIGVNTMILRDTEGIGFAIPFQTVREEFGQHLPSQ